jgi:hypothetical protein
MRSRSGSAGVSRFQFGYYRTTQINHAIAQRLLRSIALKNLAIFRQYQADLI